jgi:hypothetical protein
MLFLTDDNEFAGEDKVRRQLAAGARTTHASRLQSPISLHQSTSDLSSSNVAQRGGRPTHTHSRNVPASGAAKAQTQTPLAPLF